MMSTIHTQSRQKQTAWLAIAALLATWALPFALSSSPAPAMPPLPSTLSDPGKLPLAFEPNVGQTDPSVRFMARAQEGIFFFTRTGVTIKMATPSLDISGSSEERGTSSAVRLEFVGASAASLATDGPPLPTKVNYFVGNDPAKWQSDVPVYAGISYSGLYDGVALKYESTQGHLKGTYTVAAGTDPSQIRWRYAGAESVTVEPSGGLQITLNSKLNSQNSKLTESAPIAWQEIEGRRVPVQAAYSMAANGTISFLLGSYNPAYPLTIDPVISYSTYLGGTAADEGDAIAVDAAGNTYVTGITGSTDFPLVSSYQPNQPGDDAFVTKFTPLGAVVYSTYLGGNGLDYGYGIAADASGSAYISGRSSSGDFPLQNAYQSSAPGGTNAFFTRLNATGSSLVYSSYFGGSGSDLSWGVAADSGGNAYLAGETRSADLPTRNAYDSTYGGGGYYDAFLTKLNTNASGDASLVYSTYLGGSLDDHAGGRVLSDVGHGVAADNAGNAYVTGQTDSTDFPTRNAYDPSYNTSTDAWLARINTTLAGDPSLVYATYLGGMGGQGDAGRDVATDGAGNAYMTGNSASLDFPTRNAYASCTSNEGPFVAKVNTAASGNGSLIYSTCFGAGGTGTAADIAVDGAGNAHVAGTTRSLSFPLVNPLQGYGGGFSDVFVLKLATTGSSLIYSTYLGGGDGESGYGVAADAENTYVTGGTFSTDFPTLNPAYPYRGAGDGFVTKINDPPVVSTFTPVPSTNTPTRTVTRTPTNVPGATNTPTRRPTFTPAPTFTPGPTNTATPSPTVGGPSPTPCAPSFSDVSPSDYFYEGVSYLFCHGAISGYSDGTFRPYNDTTRGQLVKIVVLAENWVLINPPLPRFTDVPPGSTFYTYIETAVQRQAISGYPDQTFRPNNSVTRGQVCKIIAIAERWPLIDPVDPHFSDVAVDNPFYVFIETAFSHGIIGGYSDGTFRWEANATRGQLSKIVHNAVTQP